MDYRKINEILKGKILGCGTSNHSRCSSYINLINEAFNNNIKVDVKYLCDYIEKLTDTATKQYYRISSDTCMVQNSEKIKELLRNSFIHIPPFFDAIKPSVMAELLSYPIYDSCYNEVNNLAEFLKFEESHPVFLKCVRRLSSSYHCDSNNYVANFLIKNTKITANTITELCSCRNEMLANFIAGVLDKTNETFDKDLLHIACSSLPFTKSIIQSLVFKNNKIQNNHINIVLEQGSADSIEFILDLAKSQGEVIITKEHYKTLINSRIPKNTDIDARHTLMSKGIVQKLNTNYELYLHMWDDNYTIEKMMILINYGFVPDKEDILLSVSYKKEIPMIDKFMDKIGEKLDNDFLKLCQGNNFYPKYNFNCISSELLELQALCSKKNLANLRSFLKKHNTLVPDNVCMENACGIIRNDKAIALLINAGGIINQKCLSIYLGILNDPQMTLLFNNFINNITVVQK